MNRIITRNYVFMQDCLLACWELLLFVFTPMYKWRQRGNEGNEGKQTRLLCCLPWNVALQMSVRQLPPTSMLVFLKQHLSKIK